MASRYNRTQIAHVSTPALAATMLRFDRNTLEGFVEVAVAILDCSDGDPDIENYDVDQEDDDPDYCVAGDDGMGPMLVNGHVRWGSEHDDIPG